MDQSYLQAQEISITVTIEDVLRVAPVHVAYKC